MGELANHPCVIPKSPLAVTVTNWNQLNTLNTTVTEITVPSNCLNDASLTVLDFTRSKRLKRIVIGDDCFMYVNELKLIGLNRLTKVVVGGNSFLWKYSSNDPNRHFYLKNSPKIRELRVGYYSFSDYGVCEIQGVNALEMIEMSDATFQFTSLELKSVVAENE